VDKPSLQPLHLAQRLNEKQPGLKDLRELQHVDIDADVARDIVNDLVRIDARRFEFTGNGESFLYPRTLDILSLVKERKGTSLVKTNGTPIDRTVAEELIRLGVDEVCVTTLTGTPECIQRLTTGFLIRYSIA